MNFIDDSGGAAVFDMSVQMGDGKIYWYIVVIKFI